MAILLVLLVVFLAIAQPEGRFVATGVTTLRCRQVVALSFRRFVATGVATLRRHDVGRRDPTLQGQGSDPEGGELIQDSRACPTSFDLDSWPVLWYAPPQLIALQRTPPGKHGRVRWVFPGFPNT